MVDPITAIAGITAAVNLFDRIADQIERFITKSPKPAMPPQYRMTIEERGGDLVGSYDGRETQRLTADDLAKLSPQLLTHVQVYEKSMANHYAVWSRVYPRLATLDSPMQKAQVEAQLDEVIRSMRGDLDGILGFLETAGFQLDDHYQHIRHLVQQH